MAQSSATSTKPTDELNAYLSNLDCTTLPTANQAD